MNYRTHEQLFKIILRKILCLPRTKNTHFYDYLIKKSFMFTQKIKDLRVLTKMKGQSNTFRTNLLL